MFNIELEHQARAIRQQKENKGIQNRKEKVKLSLFANGIILYKDNPKDSTKKVLEKNQQIQKYCRIQNQHI